VGTTKTAPTALERPDRFALRPELLYLPITEDIRMATGLETRADLHVQIPAEFKIRLDHMAAEQQRRKHEVVLDALREYLERHERPNIRSDRRPK
jgi:hypothetical protein